MRASDWIIGPAIGVAYMAIIRSPVVDQPRDLLELLLGTLAAAMVIDRVHVALRHKRPVSRFVTAILLMAIKKHAYRIYLRNDGTQLAVWFEHRGGQHLEMCPPLALHAAIVDELRWRFGRWGVNGTLTLGLAGRWATFRIRYDDIGGAVARIDLEQRVPGE